MVARFTRFVLLFQALTVIGLALAVYHFRASNNAATAILIAIAALFLARLAIVANNFFLAWIFRSETPQESRLGFGQACHMFLEEFVSSMSMWFWYMPFAVFRDRYFSDSKAPPVLLIPGYGGNSAYWIPLSRRLTRERISHRAIDLEPMFGGIEEFIPSMHTAIENYCRDAGQEKIIIVAHSMGGLAARAYLCEHGARRVAKLITLGTPHHGTHLARFGKGINSLQMRRSGSALEGRASEWLCRLAEQETRTDSNLLVSIYTHHDNIVAPQSSSVLPGARNIAFHGVGHVALAVSPKVQDKIVEEILHFESQPQTSLKMQ